MNKTWVLDRPAEVVDELAQVKDTFYESARYARLVPDVMDEEVRLFSGKRCSPLPNGVQFPLPNLACELLETEFLRVDVHVVVVGQARTPIKTPLNLRWAVTPLR